MAFASRINYSIQDDRQIVDLVVRPPHNEEAAVFLLYDRYRPLLRHIYRSLQSDNEWYNDCVDELFIHLRGRDGQWHILASFEWRSTLGCWLTKVARNKFIETLKRLIENEELIVSIDTGNGDSREPVQLPGRGEEEYERRERKVMLMEAIAALKDDDQRFVILKRLEGYDSNEIALLMQKRWQKHGIVKYNNKGQRVVPDAAYVDVRTQRAKANLRLIIVGEK